jgi:hypothetical protein
LSALKLSGQITGKAGKKIEIGCLDTEFSLFAIDEIDSYDNHAV